MSATRTHALAPKGTHPRKRGAHCQRQIAISVQTKAQPLERPAAPTERFAAGVDGELATVDRHGDVTPENGDEQPTDLVFELLRQPTEDGRTINLVHNFYGQAHVIATILAVREDDSQIGQCQQVRD
jgi:hypothetical protein